MGDGGFFKGTSAGQDTRFSDKHQKLMRSMKFPKVYSQKVDMKKVSMEVIRGWMVRRIRELLGIDDEVVIEYALGMLQEEVPDPKSMQINLQGFLDKNSQVFVLELWKLLLDAQTSLGGIPRVFIEEKKAELLSSRANKEADLASVRTQEDKEKAVADEIRRKATEIRQASRPNAASFDNSVVAADGNHKRERSVPLVATTEMSLAGTAAAIQGITTPEIGTGSRETIAESDQGAETHMRAGEMTDTGSQAETGAEIGAEIGAMTVSDMAETAETTVTAETLVTGVAVGITAGTMDAVPITKMRETEAGALTGTVEDHLMVTANASAQHPGAGPVAGKEGAIHL
ncbi:hypothetical protein BGZ93_007737 [Podila epicladia]|nr:hypothetical protein BGZ92_005592 [Podila epicladia]KAG0093748.1 hypothetical protein BGZ93_007737 [Podila epicladia]